MNLPNNNDSWIILGPGRTGSKILVDSLTELYQLHNIDLATVEPTDDIVSISPSTIYHSHLMSDTDFGNTVTYFVISIRDMVDCALSWTKRPHIGHYHLYEKTHSTHIQSLNNKIPAFYLDPNILLAEYNRVVMFYKVLNIDHVKNILIVDYDGVCGSGTRLLETLDFPCLVNPTSIPIKNPGTNEEWIINWVEISQIISTLERRPENILLEKLTISTNNCILV